MIQNVNFPFEKVAVKKLQYLLWIIFVGVPISLVFVEVQSTNSSNPDIAVFCIIQKNVAARNVETHQIDQYVLLVQSLKIGTR